MVITNYNNYIILRNSGNFHRLKISLVVYSDEAKNVSTPNNIRVNFRRLVLVMKTKLRQILKFFKNMLTKNFRSKI